MHHYERRQYKYSSPILKTKDPAAEKLHKKILPEDVTIDTLRHLSSDSFAMWSLTSGAKVDGYDVDFNNHRYLLPIYLNNDKEIVWQKAAQLGATVYLLLRVLWWLENHQGRKAGLYFPTKEGVDNLSKDRLSPLIQSCPSIAKIADTNDKLGLRRIGKSSFYLYHLGGVASKDSVPLDFLAFDEVRLCSPKDIDQALQRVSHSKYKYKIFMSTCFHEDEKILVRKRTSDASIEEKSFAELRNCWMNYNALCLDSGRATEQEITAFHDNGKRDTVSVSFSDGSTVRCTLDHKFAQKECSFSPIRYNKLQDILQSKDRSVVTTSNNELGFLHIVSVVNKGPATVCDVTVANHHNYVLSNRTVVHNCGVSDTTINARFKLGTQHSWHSKCGCSDGVNLALAFPDCMVVDERRNEIYYRCPKCKWRINDPQNGRYVPYNPNADYVSYHVSQLVSKFKTPKEIWDFYKRTVNMEEFYNATLGLPYVDEANRGVTPELLSRAINPELRWEPVKRNETMAMGVDQGAGYNMVIIAHINPDSNRKRIRHIEIIERDNRAYFKNGVKVSPFVRLRELMKEWNVQVCVLDAMPNANDALQFAQEFSGRVWTAHYTQSNTDVVQWGDRSTTKSTLKKAGPLLNFKYHAVLSRYNSLSFSLGDWSNGAVELPDPDGLIQVCRDEKTGIFQPESPAHRLFSHLPRLIKQFRVTNEETGEGRNEWIYAGGDPHLAHAWNYCDVALERLRRRVSYEFF